jgi:protease IV
MNPSDDFAPTTPPPLPPPLPPNAPPTASAPAPVAAPRPAVEAPLETVARALLQDRRSERRWRVFFRLAWLGIVLALLWGLFVARNHISAPGGPHTALVEVRGEIAADTEASAERVVAALKNAFEDKGAQAIVLRINSPGGSPVQSGIVNDEIKRLKAKHNKKVYAVVEEICASGAYYIAVAADEIYVDKASLVGSIGVLMDGFGFTGTMEKLGVERRLLTAGENKGMLDPFSPQNEKQTAYAKAMIDQIHLQFISVVKDGRGPRLKESKEMFSGLFWNGEEAIKLGLADKIGNLDFVAREVIKAEEIIDYTTHDNLAERFAKRFGAAIGYGAIKALRELPPLR